MLGVFLITLYGFISYTLYRRNDFKWPTILKVINICLIVLVSVSLLLVAGFDDSFDQFEALTITFTLLICLTGSAALILLNRDKA